MSAFKRSDGPRPKPSLQETGAMWTVVGALTGPVLGVLFTWARLGPAGLIWFQGKGGQTILTGTGRMICGAVMLIGAIAGGLCGWIMTAMYHSKTGIVTHKRVTPQEHLWDPYVDGR